MVDEFALPLPGEPGPVRLMNTVWADRHGVHDALGSVDGLRRWLAATTPGQPDGDGDTGVTAAELAEFRTVRDALRRLAAVVTADARTLGASPTGDVRRAVTDLNAAVTAASTWPQLDFRDGALHRRSAGTATPALRALAGLAADGVELLSGPDRDRLRACGAPGCVLYFVRDHPRREWCSPACGNRVRAARHYQRHRQT